MEEGFRWNLVLGGRDGETALLKHSQHLQKLIWKNCIKGNEKGKQFTLFSNDILKHFTIRVPDTCFHKIVFVGEERPINITHSLKLGLC